MDSVSLFLINARPSMSQEIVSRAMLDITSLWVNANLHQLNSLQMKDVELGTGRIKNA